MTAPVLVATCRRCGSPAAGTVSVAELDGELVAGAPVAEAALCGACL